LCLPFTLPSCNKLRIAELLCSFVICGSSVGIATAYRLNDREVKSSNPCKVKNFHFSISSRPALGSTHHPIQGVPRGSFPGGKAVGAWSWLLTSNYCRSQENADLYIHSPIRLHSVVLNYFCTRTTFPALCNFIEIYWRFSFSFGWSGVPVTEPLHGYLHAVLHTSQAQLTTFLSEQKISGAYYLEKGRIHFMPNTLSNLEIIQRKGSEAPEEDGLFQFSANQWNLYFCERIELYLWIVRSYSTAYSWVEGLKWPLARS
jgi:hypothetical protein